MSSGESSAPGARLAEMDRLLRDIQAELVPGREPAPALLDDALVRESTPPPEAPVPRPRPPASDAHVQVLSELSAGLLASMRELLAAYERVLVGRPAPPTAHRPGGRRPDSPGVTLSAAPFPSLEALHEFEAAVARLPGVRGVGVQGYEGTDRAIIEVRLDPSR